MTASADSPAVQFEPVPLAVDDRVVPEPSVSAQVAQRGASVVRRPVTSRIRIR